MPISVSGQAHIFLYSLAGGMLIAFIYDIFRIKRKAVRTGSITIYVEDFVYWIIAALVMFGIVYYSNDGEIRGFILLGAAIGVIAYVLLFSKMVIRLSLFVINIICTILKFVWTVLTYPFKVIFKVLNLPLGFLLKKLRSLFKKVKRGGRSRAGKIAIWSRLIRNIIKKI